MRPIWLLFVLFTLVFSSCNNYKVVSFNNPELKQQQYSTYKIITKAPDSLLYNERSVYNEFYDAVKSEMADKGFQLVSGESDLLLRYKFFSNRRSDLTAFRNRSIYDPGFLNFSARNFTESILLVDVHDRDKEKLVWQGSLDLNLPSYQNRKVKDLAQTVVNEIFDTFQFSNNED